MRQILFLILSLFLFCCKSAKITDKSFSKEDIIVEQVKPNVYRHITFFQSETFGKVACNGMVVFDKGEAIIFDTPVNDSTSSQLINWVQDSLDCKVIAIIATHFHEDCVGGLKEFQRRGIPSYAENRTIASTKLKNFPTPEKGFDNKLALKAGNKDVVTEYFGEGHTKDNVVGYFPSEKVMFGGCLIKEIGAGKGNLEDANESAWSATVTKLKQTYPDVQVVIPGHGKPGDTALLDYTIKLFEKK
ncbi:subclass B1 metallo-beta-lactamase [Dyadobacter chenwenxiniae]|uniref:beta-lactamase n=1 Tax=Dyadobacter chenwenxiniae TaxID=2906456 RepID=A0A9X1PI56_9BACT|nr:subclass B1 metallo-beta-lactamase [Dyadobacter chenwenxiniae]MCF0060514.1 subclass B1 metallo-beta-lactamase [Dyadobacter chenwenxiniae]UON86246.1 subclass B1 metallo-beta-lactamase [Dyadobacter chenwenxiniae]